MANMSNFLITAQGGRENLIQFLSIFYNDVDSGKPHFFGLEMQEEMDTILECIEEAESNCELKIGGTCKWNISACMTKSDNSYFSQEKNKEIKETFISLQEASKLYGINIEARGYEPGKFTIEHGLYLKGKEAFWEEDGELFISYYTPLFDSYEDFESRTKYDRYANKLGEVDIKDYFVDKSADVINIYYDITEYDAEVPEDFMDVDEFIYDYIWLKNNLDFVKNK